MEKRLRVYWTGIALYGDPLFDVAGSFFWSPWLDCMRIQSEFFQQTLRNEVNLLCACSAISSDVDLKKSMKMLWQEIKNC